MSIRSLSFRNLLGFFETPVTLLMSQLRHRDSRGPMLFVISSAIKSMAQMISALIVARLVLPQDMGTWYSVSTIEPYWYVISLGISLSLMREYAWYRGKGDMDQALRTGWVGLTYSLFWGVSSLLIVSAILIYSIVNHTDHKTLLAISFFAFQAFLNPICMTLNDFYRGGDEFMQLGKIQLAEAGYLFISIVIVSVGGWIGLFVRYASIACVAIGLRYLWRPVPWRLEWDWAIFRRLARLGLKMLYDYYIWSLVFVADRTLIAAILTKKEMGYYALAMSAQTAIIVMPVSLRQIIYARMSFNYGQTAQASSLWRITFMPVLFNAVFLLVPLAVLYVLIGPFIRAFLPQYVPATRATQLMLLSGYFLCLQTSRSVFPAMNQMLLYNILTTSMLALMWILGYVLITTYRTIDSIAVAMVIVMALHALGVNLLAYYTIKTTSRREPVPTGLAVSR